jgi:hypothetical protein
MGDCVIGSEGSTTSLHSMIFGAKDTISTLYTLPFSQPAINSFPAPRAQSLSKNVYITVFFFKKKKDANH